MTLEKRIETLKMQINTLKGVAEHYKNPKATNEEIAYDEEILGYLLELQKLRSLHSAETKAVGEEVAIRG